MSKEEMKIGRRFEDKVAIVTASTQGIGFSIAERLGLEGAAVVVSSRKQKNVDEAVEKLKNKGIQVLGVVCQVSNAQQRKDLINKTVEKYGKIDVVVSNAAANPTVSLLLETPESVLDKVWEINVKASVLLLQIIISVALSGYFSGPALGTGLYTVVCPNQFTWYVFSKIKEAAPYLQKGSSVVLISSIMGYHPQIAMAMYGITKTALLGLTKALAKEMAPDTRVNCVAPGLVPTNFAAFLTKDEVLRKTAEESTLLGKLGTPGDMAAAASFLASDDASYITGETLVVAGGAPSRL
ncbi:hypothetical protein Goklo_003429 [Gossypium klotzschianum]|uniref:Tropinone reductase-like 3 n=1 Tax=Gossypium klotzschianum TaxID=34286 RepID=A0A7J8VKN2_9ROSI|nr:hypothetical protein [Gossypium klotzschianum]